MSGDQSRSVGAPIADPRAQQLVQLLDLAPHPEGGFYKETFRAAQAVAPADGRGPRRGLTAIWFLLPAGAVSRWHRVTSDEAWHWYEGAPLELVSFPPEGGQPTATRLGPLAEGATPQHVVPAGWWQAARSTGAYTFVGCTVGPGFDFADFTMLSDIPAAERPTVASPLLPEFL